MKRIEHGTAGTAGTVTMGAVRCGDGVKLEVVVHAALLRLMPWYRGGTGVAAVVLPYGGGTLEISRAGLDAPYRLLARSADRLDKLPPVQLRVPALAGMADTDWPAEAVAYERWPTTLILTLPAWARGAVRARDMQVAGGVA